MKSEIEMLPASVDFGATALRDLHDLCDQVATVFPFFKATWKKTASVPFPVYELKVFANDGRIWRTTNTFDDLANPRLEFNVCAAVWRSSETSKLRDLRVLFITLYQINPSLDEVTVLRSA